MLILWLVLELWQFLYIKGWPDIQKSEIPSSEFCPISGDWTELGISGDWTELGKPTLVGMSLIKCYWMLQNVELQPMFFLCSKRKPTGGDSFRVKIPLKGFFGKKYFAKY